MSTHVDADDVELTRGERLLAVVLAVFLLVGGIWGYAQLEPDDPPYRDATSALTAPQRQALDARDEADFRAETAAQRVEDVRERVTDRREEYRTALDAGRDGGALERRYRGAQADLATAERRATVRRDQRRAADRAAAPIEARVRAADARLTKERDAARTHDERVAAALRVLLVLVALGGSLALMVRQRARGSRRIVVGYAAVGASATLALVLAGDYLSDVVDPVDLGPLAIAVLGAGATLAAITALQRSIARRLPGRRVRRAECPFCGFPVGRGEHCEGCGRGVVADCSRCAEPRRVGTAHCAACGER